MDKVLNWKKSSISYATYGVGPKPVIAFHGYGQTKEVFKRLSDVFGSDYQIVAVDLPFHGKTIWKGQEMVEEEELMAFSQDFLKAVGVHAKFSVLAYSIGGNFALSIASVFAERMDTLWLLAADGLKYKPGYRFITQTVLGKWVFKGFVEFPQPAIGIIKLLHFIGFYPYKLKQFFLSNISTKEKRYDIYRRWRSVSVMIRSRREVIRKLNKHHIRVNLLFGKYDKIISYKSAIKIDRQLKNSNLVILEDGHQLLNEQTFKELKKLL